MKKQIILFILFLICSLGIAQETKEVVKDSVATESKWSAAVDVVYPYLWRGVKYYGNKVAFQPYINYDITDKLNFEIWATTNFSNAADAYNEFDWTITYQVSPVFSIDLSDYYWPATSNNLDWSRANYFDYSENSAQTLDLSLLFDFSEKGFPVDFTWSTFIAGNDFKYDEEGNSTTRAFSSYAEMGYSYLHKKTDLTIRPFVGAVIINGGYYGTDASGNAGFTFSNVGVSIDKEIKITENYSLPVFIQYQNNDYGIQQFDSEGNLTKTIRNFVSCGTTFKVF